MADIETKDVRGMLACAVQCWLVYVKMTISFLSHKGETEPKRELRVCTCAKEFCLFFLCVKGVVYLSMINYLPRMVKLCDLRRNHPQVTSCLRPVVRCCLLREGCNYMCVPFMQNLTCVRFSTCYLEPLYPPLIIRRASMDAVHSCLMNHLFPCFYLSIPCCSPQRRRARL